MLKPDLKPTDYLEFRGVIRLSPDNTTAVYVFNENGTLIQLPRNDALALVDSYPAKQRNCKVAFNDIRIKASVMAVTPTRPEGLVLYTMA